MKGFPTKYKDLIRLLLILGFTENVASGRGGHFKYTHPTRQPLVTNQRPFIMVPRHNFEHGNFHRIIKRELKAFGFSEKEIKEACKMI